jgi:hypothetical protein
MTLIKVGFCVAYDWPLLQYAIPAIYDHADVIFISIDRLKKTWAGEYYEFDQKKFDSFTQTIDKEHKIKLHVDDYYVASLTTAQNEVRQRQKLSEAMGSGGWHIQLDCDEYFLQFGDFVQYLKSLSFPDARYNVCCPLITVFKEVEGGYLCVQPKEAKDSEYIQIASQSPQYLHGRRNGHFNLYTNFLILHQSWARSDDEVIQKIANWGHNRDFEPRAFLQLWTALDKNNYTQLKNFHPLKPNLWPTLAFYSASSIAELIKKFPVWSFPQLTNWQITKKNSRVLSKLMALLHRITKFK